MSRFLFFVGVLLGAIVIVIDGYLSVRFLGNVEKSVALRNQSIIEIFKLESYLSTVKDAETGQRGYILTGKKEYLAPYEAALVTLKAPDIVAIFNQLEQRPKYSDKVQRLEKLVSERLEEMNVVLDDYKKSGLEGAQKRLAQDIGKNLMDQIRGQVDIILLTMQMDAQETDVQLRSHFVRVIKLIMAVNIVYVILMTLCLFFLFRKTDEA